MTDAANAMRRHGSHMTTAVQLAQTDLSEEQRQEIAAGVGASFEEAQAAWDTYREHLIEHGFLRAE